MTARAARGATALVLAVLASGLPQGARAQAVAPWRTDDIRVAQSGPSHPANVTTRFEVAENGDARITTPPAEGRTQAGGTILVIAGRWLLSRGYAPSRHAIGVLDEATFNSQLVILLLNAALPHGPPKPGGETPVSFSERNKPIRISTPTASAVYGAPWSMTGTVTVTEFGAPAAFRLTFNYLDDVGKSATSVLSGTIGAAAAPLSLPDSMRLGGWTIRRIDAPAPAKAAELLPVVHPKATTLGELRRE